MGDTEKAPFSHEEALELCGHTADETEDFVMQQTMLRIKDPRVSLPFYSKVLGMRLLTKADFPSMKFSLYFMGYDENTPGALGSSARTEWALAQKATVELTHNWGTETDPNFTYHNGNQDPKGFADRESMKYPGRRSHHSVREEIQIQTDRLEDVLEYADDLESEHVLAYVVSYFEDCRLPYFWAQGELVRLKVNISNDNAI